MGLEVNFWVPNGGEFDCDRAALCIWVYFMVTLRPARRDREDVVLNHSRPIFEERGVALVRRFRSAVPVLGRSRPGISTVDQETKFWILLRHQNTYSL